MMSRTFGSRGIPGFAARFRLRDGAGPGRPPGAVGARAPDRFRAAARSSRSVSALRAVEREVPELARVLRRGRRARGCRRATRCTASGRSAPSGPGRRANLCTAETARVLDRSARIVEQGPQAHPVEPLGLRQSREVEERREHVDQLDQAIAGPAAGCDTRAGHDQRRPQRLLEEHVRARPRPGAARCRPPRPRPCGRGAQGGPAPPGPPRPARPRADT